MAPRPARPAPLANGRGRRSRPSSRGPRATRSLRAHGLRCRDAGLLADPGQRAEQNLAQRHGRGQGARPADHGAGEGWPRTWPPTSRTPPRTRRSTSSRLRRSPPRPCSRKAAALAQPRAESWHRPVGDLIQLLSRHGIRRRVARSSGTWTTSLTASSRARGLPTRSTTGSQRLEVQPARRAGVAGGARPLPARRGAGLPVGQPLDHRARPARAPGRHLARDARADPRRAAAGPSTSTRAASTRCSASSGCRRPTSTGSRTTRAASPCRRSSTSRRRQVVTNDFPWITHDLFFEWREHHRPDAPDLWPADLPRGDGGGDAAGLHRGQQRRLPLRLRRLAGGVRRRRTTGCGRRWTGSRSG